MKVAAVRIVADALRGLTAGTVGVNAKLATVLRDGGDGQPADVTVYDETGDPDAALGMIPERAKRPAVLVFLFGLTDSLLHTVEAPVREYQLVLGIRVVRTEAETAQGLAALYYTEDAVLESLRVLHTNENLPARTRSGVVLEVARSVQSKPAVTPESDEIVTSLIVVEYDARYVPA